MRMKCKSIKDAEHLANLFEESHIEHRDGHTWLVVDKVHRKKARA